MKQSGVTYSPNQETRDKAFGVRSDLPPVSHVALKFSLTTQRGETTHTLTHRELEIIQVALDNIIVYGQDRYILEGLIDSIEEILEQGPPQ